MARVGRSEALYTKDAARKGASRARAGLIDEAASQRKRHRRRPFQLRHSRIYAKYSYAKEEVLYSDLLRIVWSIAIARRHVAAINDCLG